MALRAVNSSDQGIQLNELANYYDLKAPHYAI